MSLWPTFWPTVYLSISQVKSLFYCKPANTQNRPGYIIRQHCPHAAMRIIAATFNYTSHCLSGRRASCAKTPRLIEMSFGKEQTSGRWWRGTVVERRSLAGELSLSCARPAAAG